MCTSGGGIDRAEAAGVGVGSKGVSGVATAPGLLAKANRRFGRGLERQTTAPGACDRSQMRRLRALASQCRTWLVRPAGFGWFLASGLMVVQGPQLGQIGAQRLESV